MHAPLRISNLNRYTEYGHPERAFFQKSETFGLGQTNWAEILWGIWGISGQTVSTILALWVSCPWENVAGSLSYKKLWFLGLKHITPKCSQNKILAVKNLGNSVHTSVFGVCGHWVQTFSSNQARRNIMGQLGFVQTIFLQLQRILA